MSRLILRMRTHVYCVKSTFFSLGGGLYFSEFPAPRRERRDAEGLSRTPDGHVVAQRTSHI